MFKCVFQCDQNVIIVAFTWFDTVLIGVILFQIGLWNGVLRLCRSPLSILDFIHFNNSLLCIRLSHFPEWNHFYHSFWRFIKKLMQLFRKIPKCDRNVVILAFYRGGKGCWLRNVCSHLCPLLKTVRKYFMDFSDDLFSFKSFNKNCSLLQTLE